MMHRKGTGFSLVELVMVIVIAGLITVMIGPLLVRPMQLFTDQKGRSLLLDRAQAAITALQREVRQALPNSLRVSGTAVEFVPVDFAGRYPFADNPADPDGLTPRQPDAAFSLMTDIPPLVGERVVVNPHNSALLYSALAGGFNGMVSPAGTTVTVVNNGNQDRLTLSAPFRFDPTGNGSPSRRAFLVTGPVTYVCSGTELRRIAGYSPSVAQPTNPAAAPLASAASNALVTDGITFCRLSYASGTSQRAGLLTIELELTENGESVRLVEQVHVENVP
jgi:MSHA biogenesis protein MshO